MKRGGKIYLWQDDGAGPEMYVQAVRGTATKRDWHLNVYSLRRVEGKWTQAEIDEGIEQGTLTSLLPYPPYTPPFQHPSLLDV